MNILPDYTHIRGVNYRMPPYEDAMRELALGKRIGLNSVRVWLSPWEYFRKGEEYCAYVKDFFRACRDSGYTVMPILWNGNMMDPAILTMDYWNERGREYTERMVSLLRDDEALLMWDLMNEPEYNPYCLKWAGSEEEKAAHFAELWDFVRRLSETVRAGDSEHPITVGHAKYPYAFETEPWVDVISFHDYSGNRDNMFETHEAMKGLSEKTGKPLIDSETGCIARSNPYDVIVEFSERYRVGYYLFELMITSYWGEIHGIFYDDGTIRDPSTVAAILGCYRNRGEGRLMPNLFRRHQLEEALESVRISLTESISGAFGYRRNPFGAVEPMEHRPELWRTRQMLTEQYGGAPELYQRKETDTLLDGVERLAHLIEGTEMAPLFDLPSARVKTWREQEHPDFDEIRSYAYDLVCRLKTACRYLG